MELPSFKSRTKKATQLQKLLRQNQFNTRYRITQKVQPYSSLNDPHASYYFGSKPAKKQLFSFRKAVSQQKNLTKKQKLTKLINSRINKTLHDQLGSKKSTYQSEQTLTDFGRLAKNSIFSLTTLYDKESTSGFKALKHTKKSFFDDCSQEEKDLILPKSRQHSRIKTQSIEIQNPQKSRLSNFRQRVETKESKRAEKLRQQLHQKKHIKWIDYLEQRKRQVQGRSLGSDRE